VQLTLVLLDDVVRLEVTDDGVGIDTTGGAGRQDSFGRRLMADQAERVGGTLAVRSAPGAGTTVRLDVPVQ
jgi:signal transduction histidine kinase